MSNTGTAAAARRIERGGRIVILPPGDGYTAWSGSSRRYPRQDPQTPLSRKGIRGNKEGGYPCPSK